MRKLAGKANIKVIYEARHVCNCRSHTVAEVEEAMASSGVQGGVFVQCYNDCPEVRQVYKYFLSVS